MNDITALASLSARTPIDVLIPAIEKDLGTLPFVIDGIRSYVQHPIGTIYIVSPESARIRSLCRTKNCTFVHEHHVLPITKKDITYRSSTWDRSGWLYQQLLKLNGDRICRNRHFLVTDADTVLIRPHTFLQNGKTIFYYRNWTHPEYLHIHARLLGQKARSPKSFVNHYMLFDSVKLSRLKRIIEHRHGVRWYTAILKQLNRRKQFGFSEFETYGNFLRSNYPSAITLRPTLNREFKKSILAVPAPERQQLARAYRSLSFHKRSGYSLRKKNSI
ncbi:DUF6492 family protein [Paenibacillus sp. YPG26]|uniref:DUF6492 family protein n=1 Tax=Paenibacillus sp. YPG26 TaxID=2878915 RepID=UPI002040CFCA|nr:DUF6492 family protein [Paenibacillus sp. YPG26]USB33781.1 DUF6492 family protein [Paenibacillus sp. YPG26]